VGDEIGKNRDDRQVRTTGASNQANIMQPKAANSQLNQGAYTADQDQLMQSNNVNQSTAQRIGLLGSTQQQNLPISQQSQSAQQYTGSAQKYNVSTTGGAMMQPSSLGASKQYEMMQPQSPHNAMPVIQQERISPNEKYLAMQQYSQPNTQVQTQTNLLPAHLIQQQHLVNQDAHKMFPEALIPIDQYGYPEGYKYDRDLTLLINEDKARIKERFFHGIGRVSLINSLVILTLSFAVFWIQLSYLLRNNYYDNNGANSVIPYRKNAFVTSGVYQEWNNANDLEVANFMLVREFDGVFITVLDQLCLYGILLINLYLIQFNWNWGLFFVNLILAGKDIAVMVAWGYEQQHYDHWGWYPGLWNWGIMFMRRPFGLPVTLALLNLFLLRIPYFVLGCSKTDGDIDSEADLYAEPPEEPGLFMKYIGYPLTRFGKAILAAYLFVSFCLLIANFFPGLVLVTLGMFGFFTLYFFVFLTTYTIPFINSKYAVRNKWYAKNYYLLIKARCRMDLIDRELKKALHAHRSYRHRENVYEYPKMLLYFVLFTFCVQYGSIWLKGGAFSALMRWIYASPFQFTFNVLTSKLHGNWMYIFRWLSAI
jgi:hypothetical protein